jgi:thiamine-phosphate pyrophosphorylase
MAAPSADISTLVQKIAAIAAAGVDWIQIREKDLSARELAKLTRDALHQRNENSRTAGCPTRILINDRLDTALSERADGVHLGEQSLPAAEVKLLIESRLQVAQALLPVPMPVTPTPTDFLLGVSCHSAEDVKSAAQAGANYVFFGPIFATPSKILFGAPQGLGQLAEVCRSVSIPVFAIGGITVENAASCLAAGAAGIAAIRLFQDAPDPAATVGQLRQLKI